jgi:hypothetical protein
MDDTHSAHLVELSQIREYRLALTTTAMLDQGMRCALLDALDRWEHETPLQYFLCVICPNGHVSIELCTQSRLENLVLGALEHLNNAECAWSLTYIGDRARMIWEDALDLYEFCTEPRPAGVTLH